MQMKKQKKQIGKKIGGTRGNIVLDFVSGSPNKETIIQEAPDIFDYNELAKYGFSHLVEPIMESGGRRAMYNLMEMQPPPLPPPQKPKSAPKLVIDRYGETDPNRYSGLKITQSIDDEEMAQALIKAQQKEKDSSSSSLPPPVMVEGEQFQVPFSDKRNISPKTTTTNPDWTPEMLDKLGQEQGKAKTWARKARDGEFKSDPNESISIEGMNLRIYSSFSWFIIAFAFGQSTDPLLSMIFGDNNNEQQRHVVMNVVLQPMGLVLFLAAIGSSLVCSTIFAPEKNRNSIVWAIRGILAGPVALFQLRSLDALKTRGETEEIE